MRRKVTVERLKQFMDALAASARSPGKVYFTGGATALLLGFREQTIDIDIKLDPEPKGVFEAIASLKNRRDLNVQLASPDTFIPAPRDWRDRSRHIASIPSIEFFHYDFTLQALSKLERGHQQDLEDVAKFLSGGYVTGDSLRKCLAEIQPDLIRYPAINPRRFTARVEKFLQDHA